VDDLLERVVVECPDVQMIAAARRSFDEFVRERRAGIERG
jgi:hypothetical protein